MKEGGRKSWSIFGYAMALVRSVPVHTTKAYESGGGVTPLIPNHGGLLKVKEPPVPFNRWLDGRQSRPGRCAERKNTKASIKISGIRTKI
jgi:hypothetical protein